MNKRLYHMAIFALVVEEGSFAGAARSLGRAPSVVSTHVRELEQHYDARLLHRTTRRLALTPDGERYLPHCQTILAALRQADTLASTLRATVSGRLRVTAPSALLELLVVPALAALLEAHPAVEVELAESDSRDALDTGETDVAVRVGALTKLDHRARRLGELHDVRVARAGSPDRAIVLPWQRHASAAAAGLASLRASCVVAARTLVRQGLGWAVLPAPAIHALVAAGELEIQSEGKPAPIYAVHAYGPKAPPQVRAFIDFAVRTADQAARTNSLVRARAPLTPG